MNNKLIFMKTMNRKEHKQMQLRMTIIIGISFVVCCSFFVITVVVCKYEKKVNKVEVEEIVEATQK